MNCSYLLNCLSQIRAAFVRQLTILLTVSALFLSCEATAGNISFLLSLTGSTLTLTGQGDSSAFYPRVLRLLPDGRWEPLVSTKSLPPNELIPGAHTDFIYPESSQPSSPFASMQPTMVRFYDSAGVSFGQISFFHQPSQTSEILMANYTGGKLVISPPVNPSTSIRSSWLLWPQQDGIAQIRGRQQFEARQPAALHFDWRPGMESPNINTGAGQPAAILLHETASGYFLQTIPGGLQVNEQRIAWLNDSRLFYKVALFLTVIAALTFLLHFVSGKKNSLN